MGRAVTVERVALSLCVGLVLIAGVAPLSVMALDSVRVDGRFGFDHYRALIAAARFWPLFGNSIGLALVTTVVCAVVGIPTGVLFAKSDVPFRSGFVWLLTIPFVLPPYFTALGWARVLSRIAGSPSDWLFGFGGCVLVLSTVFLPLTVILTVASVASVDGRLEEAGRLVSGWPKVLRRITLPLSRPGVLFSLMLVFLLAMGEFSVPNVLRYPVLPVLSFTQFTASYNFGAATAAAVPLALVALVAVLGESAVLHEQVFAFRGAGGALTIPLGRWRSASAAGVALVCSVLVILPLGALFADAFSLTGIDEAWRRASASVVRSVIYSALAATLLMAIGFVLGLAMRKGGAVLGVITLALFAMPGTVLSIGLIRLWNRPGTGFIYTTPALLILGYTAQYCAVTTRLSRAGLLSIPKSLEEAARLSGASWTRRLFQILAPLSARTLVCGWLAAYILCLRDVPLALTAAPPGGDPLPARILTLMANGSQPMIASLCLIMAIASLIPLALLARFIPSPTVSK